jgi:hypothetical protein
MERRYRRLWGELTEEVSFAPDQRYRVEERVRQLNALGFAVEEVEVLAEEGGYRLRLNPRVVDPGYHVRTLRALTGLTVQENQARRLLDDLARYRADLDRSGSTGITEAAVARRWLTEVFERTVASVPRRLRGRLEPAELYHQVLDHRWYLSEAAGHDVGLDDAVASFVATVLPGETRPRGPAPG